MTRVYIFCEGQTEETFVREVLQSYFSPKEIFFTPLLVRSSKRGRGGVSTYGKIKYQIEKQCKEDPEAWVTTLLDYYQFPQDLIRPSNKKTSIDQAIDLQQAFEKDISQKNFIAHLVVHEFEGLLFSFPEAFRDWYDDTSKINKLLEIRNQFPSPEHINDGLSTAPSKRILSICNAYDKVLHGSLIAIDIGLDTIRKECPLFNNWIKRIEALC